MDKEISDIELGSLVALIFLAAKKHLRLIVAAVIAVNLMVIVTVLSLGPFSRVEAILEPGIIGTGLYGAIIPVEKPEALAQRISSSATINHVRAKLNISGGEGPDLAFEASFFEDPKVIRGAWHYSVAVRCNASDPAIAKAALSCLIDHLAEEAPPAVDRRIGQLDREIGEKSRKHDSLRQTMETYVEHNIPRIQWYKTGIEDLESEAKGIADAINEKDWKNLARLSELKEQKAQIESKIGQYRKLLVDYDFELNAEYRPQIEILEADLARLEALREMVKPLTVIMPATQFHDPLRHKSAIIFGVFLASILFIVLATATWDIWRGSWT